MWSARILPRALWALAIVGGVVVVTTAQEREENDNATLRRIALYRWYNDDAPAPRPGSDHRVSPFSQRYQRFLNEAAARERARYAAQLPSVSTSLDPSLPVGASTPREWVNIGPTKANYLQNGSYTLNITDTGRVRTIITHPGDPNTIYVAFAGGGVWKTTNGGANWVSLTESLGTLSCGALAMDPNNPSILYLGLGDPFDGTGVGLVKSIDAGATWSAPVYLGDSSTTADLIVSPADSNIVLAATNKGLFRSTNAGATFASVSLTTGSASTPAAWSITSGGGNRFIASIEATPEVASGTTNGQIWVTTDGGAAWTRATGVAAGRSGVGRITVAAAPSNPTIVYAMAAVPNSTSSSDLADIFKSVNGGTSWTALKAPRKSYSNSNRESRTVGTLLNAQGWYNQLVMVNPTDPNRAYFGGALLLATTGDGGSTFSQVTNWLAQFGLPYVHADFHAGHIDASGVLYVGTDGGIFRSTNGGTSWSDVNEGIVTHLLYSVGSSPNAPNAVIGGMQDNGTRVRVADSSVFNQEIGGDGFGSDINPVTPTQMLGSLYYSRIYKSTDSGLNFTQSCSGIPECGTSNAPFITRVVSFPGDSTGKTVFTTSNSKVYKSTNYAGSWSALGTSGLPSANVIRNVGVSRTDANYLGLVFSGGLVFFSTNGGLTWTAAVTPTDNGLSLSSIAFDDANGTAYVASVAPDSTKAHLWKTADFGATWIKLDVASGLPQGVPVNQVAKVGGTLYAATHLGVYISTNDGASFTRWGSGLPLVNVWELNFSNASRIRAASYGRGFWEIIP